ncbi:MAG: histidine kinase [Bacteroidales bacterium]|nr:histidine kinase [Bacteroidales bacterium]
MFLKKLVVISILSISYLIASAKSDIDTSLLCNYLKTAENYCLTNTDSAFYYSQKAINYLALITDPYLVSRVYRCRGKVFAYKFQYDSAEYYYNKAVTIIPKDRVTDLARLYNSYGGVLMYQNKFDTALYYLQKSNAILKNLNLKKDLMNNYLNLGAAYRWERSFEISTRYNFQGLPIAEELHDTLQIIRFLYTIGVNYQLMKKPELAIFHCQKALAYAMATKNYQQVSMLTNVIALSYKELKQDNEALKNFQLAFYYARMANFSTVEAVSLINIGDYYTEHDQYDSAMIFLKRGDSIAHKINNLYIITGANISFGELYMKTNQYDKALDHFLNAIKNKDDVEYSLINGAYLKLSRLYKAMGNYTKAYEYHVIYSERNDSSLNEQKADEIANLKMQYELNKKQEQMDAELKDETERLKLVRTLTIFGFVVSLIIATLLVITFRFKQKQRIINLKNEIDGYRQRLMAQQMNPHFIFNTLNSIQYFIYNNKKEESMEYVSQFAQLMRLNLHNSQNDIIALEDEIQALKLYLELEKIRMNNKFDYTIEIDPGIDMKEQLVPSFLIQPLVENSIKHGVLKIKHKGNIFTKVHRNNGNLVYTIIDNGIGFERSKASQESTKHKSYGIELTKKRIVLLGILKNKHTSFTCTDLKEPNGECKGSKVELVIPSLLG